MGFPGGSVVKEYACNAGDAGDIGLIPGSETSPGEGHGNPFQYSCLENPMDRGAWWTAVHRVIESEVTEHACNSFVCGFVYFYGFIYFYMGSYIYIGCIYWYCHIWNKNWGTLKIFGGHFPGSPVVKTPCFHCRRHRYHPWSKNWDPT